MVLGGVLGLGSQFEVRILVVLLVAIPMVYVLVRRQRSPKATRHDEPVFVDPSSVVRHDDQRIVGWDDDLNISARCDVSAAPPAWMRLSARPSLGLNRRPMPCSAGVTPKVLRLAVSKLDDPLSPTVDASMENTATSHVDILPYIVAAAG